MSAATHCVLCGFEAVLAPRVHLRDLAAGAPLRDVTLGLCETHGTRLRKGGAARPPGDRIVAHE